MENVIPLSSALAIAFQSFAGPLVINLSNSLIVTAKEHIPQSFMSGEQVSPIRVIAKTIFQMGGI
jgi:hypothetical protein